MNKHKLRYVMAINGDNDSSLAKFLKIGKNTFSRKINEHGATFSQKQMKAISQKYHLTADDFISIFFDDEVSNFATSPPKE